MDIGIEPSVGNVGDAYDNALTESLNGLYKTEVAYAKDRGNSHPGLGFDWFNHRRLTASQPANNYWPPVEKEALYYQPLNESAKAARLKPNRLR